MFKVTIGEEGRFDSWQDPFPPTTDCVYCQAEARFAFSVFETFNFHNPLKAHEGTLASLHKSDPNGEGLWLHDCCTVAVYFCRVCGKPTALYNQA